MRRGWGVFGRTLRDIYSKCRGIDVDFVRVDDCHELAFFTFFSLLFFIILTLYITVPGLQSKNKLTPCYPFRLLTLFQTIKKTEKRVYSVP